MKHMILCDSPALWQALGIDIIPQRIFSILDSNGRTLLHALAKVLGYIRMGNLNPVPSLFKLCYERHVIIAERLEGTF